MPDLEAVYESSRYDPDVVAVRTCDKQDRFMIGCVPRYLARDVRQICFSCDPDVISVKVVRVNRDAPLQQRLLCRMNSCWPEGFRPCAGEQFQPIAKMPFTAAN